MVVQAYILIQTDVGKAADEAGIVRKYFKKLMEKHQIAGSD